MLRSLWGALHRNTSVINSLNPTDPGIRVWFHHKHTRTQSASLNLTQRGRKKRRKSFPVVKRKLYFGDGFQGIPLASMYIYNIFTNTWVLLDRCMTCRGVSENRLAFREPILHTHTHVHVDYHPPVPSPNKTTWHTKGPFGSLVWDCRFCWTGISRFHQIQMHCFALKAVPSRHQSSSLSYFQILNSWQLLMSITSENSTKKKYTPEV